MSALGARAPRLVVIVEKDDMGKLWNYISTEEALHAQNSFWTGSLWIHKPGSSGSSSQPVQLTEPVEEDHVILGVLPREEKRVATRIKKK